MYIQIFPLRLTLLGIQIFGHHKVALLSLYTLPVPGIADFSITNTSHSQASRTSVKPKIFEVETFRGSDIDHEIFYPAKYSVHDLWA